MKFFDREIVEQIIDETLTGPVMDADVGEWLNRESITEANRLVDRLCAYFTARHLHAAQIDICSAAAVVGLFTTGAYSGFGTEEYEKELKARNLIIAFAGGVPAYDDDEEVYLPRADDEDNVRLPYDRKAWTRDAFELLESFYFGDECEAAIRAACRALNRSRSEFKSRYVARARRILESVIGRRVEETEPGDERRRRRPR